MNARRRRAEWKSIDFSDRPNPSIIHVFKGPFTEPSVISSLALSLSLSVFVLIQPFCRYMSRAFAQTHEHVNTLTRRSNESRANHRVLIEENFCQADTNHFSGNIRTYSTVWLLFERRWITFSMGGFRAPFRWILHRTYELRARLSYFWLAPYF